MTITANNIQEQITINLHKNKVTITITPIHISIYIYIRMSNKRRGNINGRTTQAFNGGRNSQDCSRSNNSRPSTRVVGNLNSEQYYADACFMTPFQYQHAYMYGIPYAHYS